MKALDKVFDTQVITGIIKINTIEAKQILYEECGKKHKKDIKVTIVTEENPNTLYQSQSDLVITVKTNQDSL